MMKSYKNKSFRTYWWVMICMSVLPMYGVIKAVMENRKDDVFPLIMIIVIWVVIYMGTGYRKLVIQDDVLMITNGFLKKSIPLDDIYTMFLSEKEMKGIRIPIIKVFHGPKNRFGTIFYKHFHQEEVVDILQTIKRRRPDVEVCKSLDIMMRQH